ncbi:Deuterolysin metalloprotease family-domain-containing protein [Pestalotiopsis sp. NC0098]|nr:Deuterolysin metalloprotease family-domain-containing protein [Pestalotiopsis sp. NC0098]
MKAAAVVSCLATLANAAVVSLDKRTASSASPLDVKIEHVGNSEVKATITNTGTSSLRVLKAGSLFDESPVEKTKVSQGASKVAFTGLRLYVHTEDLSDSAFKTIEAGETVEVQWDAAQLHDLSTGGDFKITAAGTLRYAEADSNKIAGQVLYNSNVVQATVDGVQAAKVHTAFRQATKAKRVDIQSDCSSTKQSTVDAAITVAKKYATNASAAATAGTNMEEYFKSTSSSTESAVAEVFDTIASSVFNSDSSGVALHCTDIGNACSDGVVAYTQPGSDEYIVVCDYWFQFPATGSTCHVADQPYVLIHESTHLTEVKGTDDVCYGYEGCVTDISASEELDNADTFALYANSIAVGC